MQKITEFHSLLKIIPDFIRSFPEEELTIKPAPHKWSKKEILGHLVDSALNNLKRFSEIISADTPYPILKYPQDSLVKVNQYQEMDTVEILSLFMALNRQIHRIISSYDDDTFHKKIIFPETDETQTAAWWIDDYVEHMKHHLKAIGDTHNFQTIQEYHWTRQQAIDILQANAPAEFVQLTQRGSLEIELYIPDKVDRQQPHDKDELYVIISGTGTFIREDESYEFQAHDVLFIPAFQEHRFVNFSDDFQVWVIFYGAKGGE